jgi:uncharacterized damage-inducible protein DinB
MTNLLEALLESWDRNNTILINLIKSLPEGSLDLRPSETSWPVAVHLSHIHELRLFWLGQTAPEFAQGVSSLFRVDGDNWIAQRDLGKVMAGLEASHKAVRDAVKTHIEADTATLGPYSHPVHFLQHMFWHEGYHYGQLMLALKSLKYATSDEWQEENIWNVWRAYG